MSNKLFKKGLVVGIIVLFFGLAFIPSFNAVSIGNDFEEINLIVDDSEEDCIECQHNGTLCIIYLFLRNRAYFVLLRLEIHLAFLYGFGLINLLYIYVNFIYIPQYNKILYYEEKLVEYDCGVPPLPI